MLRRKNVQSGDRGGQCEHMSLYEDAWDLCLPIPQGFRRVKTSALIREAEGWGRCEMNWVYHQSWLPPFHLQDLAHSCQVQLLPQMDPPVPPVLGPAFIPCDSGMIRQVVFISVRIEPEWLPSVSSWPPRLPGPPGLANCCYDADSPSPSPWPRCRQHHLCAQSMWTASRSWNTEPPGPAHSDRLCKDLLKFTQLIATVLFLEPY